MSESVINLAPSVASMMESVRIAAYRVSHPDQPSPRCPRSDPEICTYAELYRIEWTAPDGLDHVHQHLWCRHCSTWNVLPDRTHLILTAWLPTVGRSVAVAYVVMVPQPPSAGWHWEPQGRIGICSQWQDPVYGNVGEPGEHRVFSKRYFAESGPGVYPVPIVSNPPELIGAHEIALPRWAAPIALEWEKL
jgi:hypothetical protein